jgi:predicted Zn-dependent peptidase
MLLCLFLVLTLGQAAAAAAAPSANPPQVRTLPNGLAVVTQKDDASAITVLEILVKGGQRAEPAGRQGLAYLTTRLSMDIPDQTKVQDFMAKALHYSMTVRSDASVIHLECLTEYFDEMLGTFLEILTDPLFTGIRVDRIKEFMDHQRRIQGDDAVNVGRLAHLETFFKDTGYAGSIYGTDESLKALKTREAKDFYDRHFYGRNMVLVAVSNLDDAEMQALLGRRFGKFRAAPANVPPATPEALKASPAGAAARVIEKDSQQTYVGAAFALPAPTPRQFVLQSIVENVLGKGPGSRIWGLRTDRKLAYNVGAAATPMKEAGLLEAYLEASPEKAAEAREALARALVEFYEKGITAEELETGKSELKTSFLRTNEPKSGRATTLGTMDAVGVGVGLFASFAEELAAVRLEEANAFILAAMKPEAASWVIVGPKISKLLLTTDAGRR